MAFQKKKGTKSFDGNGLTPILAATLNFDRDRLRLMEENITLETKHFVYQVILSLLLNSVKQ